MFFFHKKQRPAVRISYELSERIPAVRCSICTGERVAGFKNLKTGKFEEYQLIRTDAELESFRQACGVEKLLVIY